ncbi:MAG TPA: bifunctional riboflavin kinase/FAD synthetase [Actinomycetota bacterium]
MNLYRSIEDIPAGLKPTAVTIGVFDGVHKGHQMLIRRVVELARETGATPGVVTFDRHPLEVVAPGKEPPMISTVEQRAQVLGGLGIEFVLVLTFDEALRRLEPGEFVRKILVDGLGATHVVVGSNFRFGYNHAGTVATLHELGAIEGFGVDIFSLLGGEDAISSTLIRRQIAGGDVETVAGELGRPFRLEGEVVRGAGRGKGLGIPTANLAISPRMAQPKIGVYAGWLTVDGVRHPAVVNVGLNPTFEDRVEPVVEIHALDFDADLYGKSVAIEFTHRLRDELKFDGPDPLVEQIRADIAQARALLGV